MNQPDNQPKLIINLHRSLWYILAVWFTTASIMSFIMGELSPTIAYVGPILLIAATLARAITMTIYFGKIKQKQNQMLSLMLFVALVLTAIIGYII